MEVLESCEIISLQKQAFLIVPRRLERLSCETPQAARNEAM